MSTNSYPLLFSSAMLNDTAGAIYSVPSTPVTATLQDLTVKLTNVTVATCTASLWSVNVGDVASNTNAVVLDISIPAKDFVLVPVERMPAESSLSALASAIDSVTIQAISGKIHNI